MAVKEAFDMMSNRLSYSLYSTNTLPMAQNWTRPLFQDDSSIGKMLAVVIRTTWIWRGGMVSVLITIPHFIFFLVVLFLPVFVIVQILRGILGV